MKTRFLIALLLLGSLTNIAWVTPRASTNAVASTDVLAASTDSYSVGSSTDVWRNGYFSRAWLKEQSTPPSAATGFGTIFASSDNNVYFMDESGTTTRLN